MNNSSALVDQVRHGETILILDRGRPVARLESVLESDSASEGRRERLERQGLLRRGARRRLSSLLDERPPRQRTGSSALGELLRERRSGR